VEDESAGAIDTALPHNALVKLDQVVGVRHLAVGAKLDFESKV
jgi:hypothetical protein